MALIAITGASGFIGKTLVGLLRANPDIQIRVLVHRHSDAAVFDSSNVVKIEGDLMVPSTMERLLTPGCTLINLAYLSSQSRQHNLSAMGSLADICTKYRIKKFIHCSTATVVGDVPDNEIDEETPCAPKSDYDITKFEIEKLLIKKAHNCFDLAILRPTAVFGPGGKNLLKLSEEICHLNRTIKYLKSCLYGHRKMNLVSVENVAKALAFLGTKAQPLNREIFYLSDDENPNNNYRYVEKYLTAKFRHKEFLLPRIPISQSALSICLKLAGKTNVNPQRVYRSSKIIDAGFQKVVSFEAALETFAHWYQKQVLSPGKYD